MELNQSASYVTLLAASLSLELLYYIVVVVVVVVAAVNF